MELKDQIKGELLKQKEEQLKKQIELNNKLTEITIYTKPDNVLCTNYLKYYSENKIKFIEKDINTYTEPTFITMTQAVPIIFVNGTYLVHGRDFQNPNNSLNLIRYFANPEYINPPFEQKIENQIKNFQVHLGKQLSNLARQIQPIVKLMNELQAEEANEQKNK